MSGIESYLYERFGERSSVHLTPATRRMLVRLSPLLAFVAAVLSGLFTYNYWVSGHQVNETAQEYLELNTTVNNLSTLWYVAFALLIIQTLLLLMAVLGLIGHKKKSWDKLFYTAFIACLLGILYLFVPGYGFANVIGSIGLALAGGFALLQTRSYFTS